MFILPNSEWWIFKQPLRQISHIEPLTFELCQFIFTLLLSLFKVLWFRNNWVKNLLCHLMLGILPRVHNVLIHFWLNKGHLFRFVKIVNELRKVCYVILVVHFSKFLENYELINARVNLLTSCILEILKWLFVMVKSLDKILKLLVSLWENILVHLLFFFGYVDCVQHRFMQTFSLVKRDFSVQFDFLVILDESFCVFRTFKVPTSESSHLCVGIGHLSDMLFASSQNFLVLLFLLINELLQSHDTISGDIVCKFLCSLGLALAVLLEARDLLRTQTNLDAEIRRALSNAVKAGCIIRLCFHTKTQKCDKLLYLLLSLDVMLSLNLKRLEQWVNGVGSHAEWSHI